MDLLYLLKFGFWFLSLEQINHQTTDDKWKVWWEGWTQNPRERDRGRRISMDWEFVSIPVSLFAMDSLYCEIFQVCWVCPCGMALPIHLQWGEEKTQGCRTDFLREGHPVWFPPSSHGWEVTSDAGKPKLPVWVLYLDYKHPSASNLPFAS